MSHELYAREHRGSGTDVTSGGIRLLRGRLCEIWEGFLPLFCVSAREEVALLFSRSLSTAFFLG